MRKTLAVLLTLSLLFSFLPVLSFTAQAATDGFYTYTVNDGQVTITDCDTTISGNICIPDHLGGYPVTALGDYAFAGCDNLVSVTIPSGVISAGQFAFSSCDNLSSVEILSGLSEISYRMFYKCASLQSVVLHSGLTSINDEAFYECKALTEITLPDSVTHIGSSAFSYCYNLVELNLGCGIVNIGERAFYYCSSLVDVLIPNSVNTIGVSVFSECENLQSVTLSNQLTSIPDRMFYYCDRLSNVTIPNNVTSIGFSAFDSCTDLTAITIPESVENIDMSAFRCSGLNEIIFQGSSPSFGKDCFAYVTSTACYPEGDDSWNDTVMQDYGGSLTWTSYSNEPPKEGYYTYSIENDQATIIACDASAKGDLVIPNTLGGYPVVAIGSDAFKLLVKLTSVTIPNTVTCIGNSAFYNCTSLQSVQIPESVNSMGSYAFGACYSLSDFEIPKNITEISKGAFWGCSSLTAVTIPDSVTTIGANAFDGCSGLTSIEIPDGVTKIGSNAFEMCNKVTSVTIPDSVTIIEAEAFMYCASLTGIKIPKGITEICDGVFYSCHSLSEISIPDNIVTIGNSAFKNCDEITKLTVSHSVKDIQDLAFGYCESLAEIVFQGNAPTFGSNCFIGVKATAYYPAENETWSQEVRQDYCGSVTWMPYEETIEKFDLSGMTMTLGNSLSVNFVIDTAKLDGDGHYAVITKAYADRDPVSVTIAQSAWTNYSGTLKNITFSGVSAKEMMDNICAVVYNADGEPVTNEYNRTIENYCTTMLGMGRPAEENTLYVDMLNYGAAAQKAFTYNTENPANKNLTAEQLALGTQTVETQDVRVKGNGYAGTTLTLKSEIMLNMVFQDAVMGNAAYAKVTYTNHYGDVKEQTIDASCFVVYGKGLTMVQITGMSVADCGQAITCELYDAQGDVLSANNVDSVESYINRMGGELNIAIMKFAVSSYNYFH